MDKLRAILGASILLLVSGQVNAAIIDLSERDWLSSGDSLVTFDSTTNLEWLDLTVTQGNSILNTEGESFYIDNGGDFRWASVGEIETLFDHLSWHLDVTPGFDSTRIENASGEPVNEFLTFIDLLGPTFSPPPGGGTRGLQALSRDSPRLD